MTRDELLENIDYAIGEYDKYNKPSFYALRAVVELHKPYAGSLNGFPTTRCTECGFAYPCPTNQAIEKELN